VEPLPPVGGFLRFQAAGALELPAELLEPRPLVWAGAGALSFAARLGAAATAFLKDGLSGGFAAVTATAELEAPGVAVRTAGRVRFNPAALAPALADASEAGAWRQRTIAEVMLRQAGEGGYSLEGVATDAARVAAAEAMAERLIARYGCLTSADDPAAGPAWVLDTAAMLDGEIVWDLEDAAEAPKGFVVASDPLETARRAAVEGFSLTHDAPVVSFDTGMHVLSISANLPPKRMGVLMLSTEVRVSPFPPDRPQTVTASAGFRDGETVKSVPIRLSPAEPLAFDYQTVAFVTHAGGAQRLVGPVLRHTGAHLTISPDSFPVRFVRVEASPGVCEAMRLDVVCRGRRGDQPWAATALLDDRTLAVALAVPRDVADGEMQVTATALEGGRTLSLASGPVADCWIDLSSFPNTGPACLDVECTFDDEAGVAAIECVPEDRVEEAGAISLVRLTPSTPRREWRWLVSHPLRDGFLWRWFSPDGGQPWSGRLAPGAPLHIRSSDCPVRPGVVETAR
jgi:hypothetical protein